MLERGNTTKSYAVTVEGDIARIILMLKTWQTTDSFAAKDREKDRAAWYRVAKCNTMEDEQAHELFRVAHTRPKHQGPHSDLPQRALVDLMSIAAAADESILVDSMASFLTALGSGTQSRPNTSRIRHAVNKLIKQYGPRSHAAYTI